jgi:predicted MFS family arabinose efflux permease
MVAPMFSDPIMRASIGGALAMAAALGIGRFVYTPILPGMMQEIPLSASEAGIVASANFLGYLLGALAAAGTWAQGRELPILRFSLVGNIVLLAAMGLTQSVVLFSLFRFLAGVVSAFVIIFVSSILFARIEESGRKELHGLQFLGVGLGIALSAVVTGALFTSGAPWQDGWYVSATVSLAGFFVSYAFIERGPAPSIPRAPEPRLPSSRPLQRVILSYGLFGFGYVVTATFLIAIVRDNEGGRVLETAVWLLAGLAAIPSVQMLNSIARRIGLARGYAVGFLIQATGVAASVAIPGAAGPLIGAVLLGATMVSITAVGIQVGRFFAPQAPRRSFALMTAAFGVGQIIGPVVAGYLAEWTGSFVLPSALAASALLAGAAIVWTVDTTQKTP